MEKESKTLALPTKPSHHLSFNGLSDNLLSTRVSCLTIKLSLFSNLQQAAYEIPFLVAAFGWQNSLAVPLLSFYSTSTDNVYTVFSVDQAGHISATPATVIFSAGGGSTGGKGGGGKRIK